MTVFKDAGPTGTPASGLTGNIESVTGNINSVSLTGNTISGSPTISNTSTSTLSVGMSVSGTGIPKGTTISSIIDGTSITISKNATTAGTGVTLTFIGSTITNISSTATLSVGMLVIGTGVPSNATILSVIAANTITLNQNASAIGTGVSLTFNTAQGTWGTAITAEEYLTSSANQSSPNYSFAFPTTGANKIVFGATTTSNGAMTRSENGRYLIVPGYFNNLGELNSNYTLPAIRTLNGSGTLGAGIQASAAGWYTSAMITEEL